MRQMCFGVCVSCVFNVCFCRHGVCSCVGKQKSSYAGDKCFYASLMYVLVYSVEGIHNRCELTSHFFCKHVPFFAFFRAKINHWFWKLFLKIVFENCFKQFVFWGPKFRPLKTQIVLQNCFVKLHVFSKKYEK